MPRILSAFIFSFFLLFSAVSFQNVSSQTENPSPNDNTEESSGFHSAEMLRKDLKLADVAAYVDIKERELVDFIGEGNCESDKGTGYCLYRLKAELKEVFKGKISGKTIEFYVSPDAGYPKKYLMGEKIVFLIWNENEEDKTQKLGTIENSTRSATALEKMRKIFDPQLLIDETDESEPYSLKSIKKEYEAADAVVYADVTSFKRGAENSGFEPLVLTAKVKEVFKGNLKAGKKIEYKDDLLYRPYREDDLGEQILYLEKNVENGKIVYSRVKYALGDIQYNILEKLRKISRKKN
ncbi:MAG TPA: hypothetical protein VF599_19805 [Pyrinomonadaceae bacterium]